MKFCVPSSPAAYIHSYVEHWLYLVNIAAWEIVCVSLAAQQQLQVFGKALGEKMGNQENQLFFVLLLLHSILPGNRNKLIS